MGSLCCTSDDSVPDMNRVSALTPAEKYYQNNIAGKLACTRKREFWVPTHLVEEVSQIIERETGHTIEWQMNRNNHKLLRII